jgi:Xaa-Pro aminopeptidase
LAQALFDEIAASGMVRPGVTETGLSREIRDLAREQFGARRHWHKRIVRAGPNTLQPYAENPPNRVIGEDDIVFLDLGPVFAEWEADFGRTFVLGDDPVKLRLRDDVAVAFAEGKRHYDTHPEITGAEMYAFAQELAAARGWEYGGPLAGHLVGQFPHARVPGKRALSYIAPDNNTPLRGVDNAGNERHWILEMHFVDRDRAVGGFYEELLTLP